MDKEQEEFETIKEAHLLMLKIDQINEEITRDWKTEYNKQFPDSQWQCKFLIF